MKAAIKFILTYYGVSILLLILSGLILKSLDGEIASYLLWFYIYNIVIGIIIFPLITFVLQLLNVNVIWKLIICILILLVTLNIVPFFADGERIITNDVLKGFFSNQHSLLGFNNVGIHIIALISFTVTYLLYRNEKFWSSNI